jgi:hypothetical protein
VDIERRTRRKIYHVQLLVHWVFREERNPDAPVVGKGRDGTVRIAPAKGLLEVMKWFLTADFLQRYHVWIYPVDYVSEQGEFALEPLLVLLRRPRIWAKEVLNVPSHRFESRHLIYLLARLQHPLGENGLNPLCRWQPRHLNAFSS